MKNKPLFFAGHGLVHIDQNQGLVGVLDEVRLRDVIKAIGHVLESDCEAI